MRIQTRVPPKPWEKKQSVFLTAVVSIVLGIVIGVIGLVALRNALDPSAAEVCARQGTCAER